MEYLTPEYMNTKRKMYFRQGFESALFSRAKNEHFADILIRTLKDCESPAEVFDLYALIFGTTLWQEKYAEMRCNGNAPIIRALEYIIIEKNPDEKELYDSFLFTVEDSFPGFRQLAMKRFATVM